MIILVDIEYINLNSHARESRFFYSMPKLREFVNNKCKTSAEITIVLPSPTAKNKNTATNASMVGNTSAKSAVKPSNIWKMVHQVHRVALHHQMKLVL